MTEKNWDKYFAWCFRFFRLFDGRADMKWDQTLLTCWGRSLYFSDELPASVSLRPPWPRCRSLTFTGGSTGGRTGGRTGAHPGPGHVRHRKRLRNVLTCSTHRLADESENSVTILYIFGEIAFYIILGVFCEDIITYYINFSIFS